MLIWFHDRKSVFDEEHLGVAAQLSSHDVSEAVVERVESVKPPQQGNRWRVQDVTVEEIFDEAVEQTYGRESRGGFPERSRELGAPDGWGNPPERSKESGQRCKNREGKKWERKLLVLSCRTRTGWLIHL